MTVDKGIFIKNVYYMLTYAFQELRQNNYEEIAGEDFDEIHDLFAEIIAHGVSYQIKQGLHRRYIEYSDHLTTMRGKLNLNDTIKFRSSARQVLACEYDEYSVDNIFNQILKSTMLLLLKHPKVKAERKHNLKRLLPYFSTVSEADLKSVRWKFLRFDRNSRTYRMLLYLCYFIVDNILLTTERGSYNLQSYSDEKLSRLFEKFVLEYYKRHHPECNPSAKQIKWNIIEDESPAKDILPILQTDIYLTIGDRTLIIDTKYYSQSMQTRYEKRTIHSNNHAQIFQYVINHDKNHTGKTDGMLLYARTQEEIQPDGQVKLGDKNMIYYRNLDLNQEFSGIRAQLEGFINMYS